MKRLAILVGALLAPLVPAQNCFDRDLGTNLGLGDDETAQGLALGFPFTFAGVTYTDVCVSSNGYIWLGPTSPDGSDFTPSEAELREGGPRICPLWGDFDPSAPGSGQIWFKTLPDSAVISWAHVYEYGTTNAVEFQVTLFSSGHIDITYGTNPAMRGGSGVEDKVFVPSDDRVILIGASPGGNPPSNLVSFATCPFLTGSDHFAEIVPMSGPSPYTDMRCNWSPAFPGYAVSAVACTMNSLPLPATFQTIGTGCPFETVSVYETFTTEGAALAPDISGTEFTFTPNDVGGYLLDAQQTRRADPDHYWNTRPPIDMVWQVPAGDDTVHRVPLPFPFFHAGGDVNEIYVSSNGFVTLGPVDPGPGVPAADLNAMLAGPPRIAAFWQDLNPAAGGNLYTVFNRVAQTFTVVWEAVPESTFGGANWFWIRLEPSGVFHVNLAQVQMVKSFSQALVGYSDGFGARKPEMTDLSAVTSMDLGRRALPLVLDAPPGMLPVLGTVFRNDVSGIAATPDGHLVFLLMGDEVMPFDLGVIGADGCTGWLNPFTATSMFNLTFGMPTTSFHVAIPEVPDLLGQKLTTQAVSDDLSANAFGWRVSNGARWMIGL